MLEWLPENWWALWLTVFLVFAVVEMITLDLFFIMLGGGALAGRAPHGPACRPALVA